MRSRCAERGRAEHTPDGDPCSCGIAAYYHRDRQRPQHPPEGDPCKQCGRDAADHKKRGKDRRKGRSGPSGPHAYVSENASPFHGIDGEGQNVGEVGPDGVRTGPHRYTYAACVREDGELVSDISAKKLGVSHLSTRRCLDWLLDLGVGRAFGYSTGYDLTKMLADLPDEALFQLQRPDLRSYTVEGKNGKLRTQHRPIHWMGFRLNFMRGKFQLQRETRLKNGKYQTEGRSFTWWDPWRFFQGAFVGALENWKILSDAQLDAMKRKKDERGADTWKDDEETRQYCRDECGALARMLRKLVEAHEHNELKLTQFFGAGSSASALMTKIGVKKFIAPVLPAMRHAVMCGFIGGHFEFNAVGPIRGPVETYDISSAYPYILSFLPCLTHGKWERIRQDRHFQRRVEKARLALVHCRVPRVDRPALDGAYGVFPWRSSKGTIVWPLENQGAWVWRDEYLAGQRLAAVVATEAWVYETECDCRPFGELPKLYADRVRIGKEGPGIVLKLAMNSCFGKCAQSTGSHPPFQSWVWAGCITSGARAMLLDALGTAGDPWDVLGFATDAIFSRRPLTLAGPRDTGTWELPDEKGELVKKPLGGWEQKTHDRGVFLLRPGVYFPLEPTEADLKHKLIKARGMSGKVLLQNADRVLDSWRRYGTTEKVRVEGLRRFVGMTTGVQQHGLPRAKAGMSQAQVNACLLENPPVRSADYGEWVPYSPDVSLAALPKRLAVMGRDGSSGGCRLAAHPTMPGESAPYEKGMKGPEALEAEEADLILSEQPGGDFSLA